MTLLDVIGVVSRSYLCMPCVVSYIATTPPSPVSIFPLFPAPRFILAGQSFQIIKTHIVVSTFRCIKYG